MTLAQPPTRAANRIGPALVILAWGVQAMVVQCILLREAVVLMYGSELAWGVVLFGWLLGIAIGAMAGGWLSRRFANAAAWLAGVLVFLSAASCVQLWALRGARGWLGVGPGELLTVPQMLLIAALLVPPISAAIGAAFPLACCVQLHRRDTGATQSHGQDARATLAGTAPNGLPLAGVYALESAGSLIGGAAFSFWAVDHLAPIQTLLICGALSIGAGALLLAASGTSRFLAPALAPLALAAALAAALFGGRLNQELIQRRWRQIAPGYELAAEVETRYQNLALGQREGQYTLYSNGQVAADFPDPYTFVPLAHFWMCEHPAPRRVLLLGGGAEGLLAQVLLHPVEHVDYVEPDPQQIALLAPRLPEPDRAALSDPRVSVHAVDARYFVKTQRGQFDLVIARLPQPTSALRARLYTAEFFHELRRAMRPPATLCLTAAAAPTRLSHASAEYLASLRQMMRTAFPEVLIGWGDPAQLLVATAPGVLATSPAELAARYRQRGIRSDFFDPAWFNGATDWLDPEKVGQRAAELDRAEAHTSTDLHPLVYLQRLAIWERMTGRPGQTGAVDFLRSIRLSWLIAGLAALAGLTLAAPRLRSRSPGARADPKRGVWRLGAPWASGAVLLSMASTGFATMALSIIWLFAFQNLYGYVYQRIGWITAVFMGGLMIASGLVSRRVKRHTDPSALSGLRRGLIAVDLCLSALALLVPFMLPFLANAQSSSAGLRLVEVTVTALVAMTGLLCGAAFGLAGALQSSTRAGEAGSAAGAVVGADHAGACLGALLTGLVMVPVFGTAATAALLAGVKLVSAVTLAVLKPSPVAG